MLSPIAAAALPLHETGGYLAAAYIVAFLTVTAYLAIMARRLSTIEDALAKLERSEQAGGPDGGTSP